MAAHHYFGFGDSSSILSIIGSFDNLGRYSSAASFSEETRSEGYDEFFDPPLESKYECPICLLGLREPVQTSCGHRFCRECIKLSLRDAVAKCPVDNAPLLETQLYPDNFAKREMMAFRVCCRLKKERGCQWKGALKDLQAHLDECPFSDVVCPNECGQTVQRQELAQHEAQCTKRHVTCEHCGGTVLAAESERHTRRCPKFPLQCVICEARGIPRDKMSEHLQRICPIQRSMCPFAAFGCPFEGLRQEVSDHMEELSDHVSYLRNAFLGPSQQQNQQQQQQPQPGVARYQSPAPGAPSLGTELRELDDELVDIFRQINECVPGNAVSSHMESRPQDHFGGSGNFPDLLHEVSRRCQRNQRGLDELRRLMNVQAPFLAVLERRQEETRVRHDRQIQELIHKVLQMETKLIEYEGRVCNGTYIWRIENFRQRRKDAVSNAMTTIHSPAFYTSLYGHKMCMRVNLNGVDSGLGRHVSLFVHMMQGEWDGILEWPFTGLITLSILDQSENGEFRCHISETLVAKPNLVAFQRPTVPMNRTGYGYVDFCQIEQLREPQYVRNNIMLVRVQVSRI